jgi:hypothetical protein
MAAKFHDGKLSRLLHLSSLIVACEQCSRFLDFKTAGMQRHFAGSRAPVIFFLVYRSNPSSSRVFGYVHST